MPAVNARSNITAEWSNRKKYPRLVKSMSTTALKVFFKSPGQDRDRRVSTRLIEQQRKDKSCTFSPLGLSCVKRAAHHRHLWWCISGDILYEKYIDPDIGFPCRKR
eukprot:g47776.t1